MFIFVLPAFKIVLGSARRPLALHAPSAIERRFLNVFAMMTEDRRQAIIDHYSYKHDCGREEAMMLAINDRNRDEGRWKTANVHYPAFHDMIRLRRVSM